jgi:hypothetical protein
VLETVDVGERKAPLGAVTIILPLLTHYVKYPNIRIWLLGRHHDYLRVQSQGKRSAISSNR